MSYRDDLGAAQARADALAQQVAALEAEKAALQAGAAARPPDPWARQRRVAKIVAQAGGVSGLAIVVAAWLSADLEALPLLRLALLLGGVSLVVASIGIGVLVSQLVVAGADEAYIIHGGTQGARVVKPGTRQLVIPFVELARRLDLSPRAAGGRFTRIFTKGGALVDAELAATARIARTLDAIERAAERFLGVDPSEIGAVAREILEAATRSVLGVLAADTAGRDPEHLADQILAAAGDDLDRMGLEVEGLHVTVAP